MDLRIIFLAYLEAPNSICVKKSTNLKEAEEVEEENINLDLDEETNELLNPTYNSINEKNELSSTEPEEVNEDPRRKRRRSSASS